MAVDPYSTHVPVVAACVAAIGGSPPPAVLELGVGFYSTPLLHALCGAIGLPLVSVESNGPWLERFRRYAGPGHELVNAPVPADWPGLRRRWGFALVDNGQLERTPCLKVLAETTELIAVHDTQAPQASYGYQPLLSSFRERFDYRAEELRLGKGPVPWTSVVSNCRNLDWIREIFG